MSNMTMKYEDWLRGCVHHDGEIVYLPCDIVLAIADWIEAHRNVVPTIDAAPRWIPCEEKLPEKEEKPYLVYLDNGHVCECRWWCLDPVFLNPTDNWRWHFMDKPQFTEVIAWMPLPEPYKGGEDE